MDFYQVGQDVALETLGIMKIAGSGGIQRLRRVLRAVSRKASRPINSVIRKSEDAGARRKEITEAWRARRAAERQSEQLNQRVIQRELTGRRRRHGVGGPASMPEPGTILSYFD